MAPWVKRGVAQQDLSFSRVLDILRKGPRTIEAVMAEAVEGWCPVCLCFTKLVVVWWELEKSPLSPCSISSGVGTKEPPVILKLPLCHSAEPSGCSDITVSHQFELLSVLKILFPPDWACMVVQSYFCSLLGFVNLNSKPCLDIAVSLCFPNCKYLAMWINISYFEGLCVNKAKWP